MGNRRVRRIGAALAAVAVVAVAAALLEHRGGITAAPRLEGPPASRDEAFFKGVNFTSEHPHPYGSAVSNEILGRLPAYGVNAIALVPYASQRMGSAEIRMQLNWERDDLVIATAAQAKRLGLKILLKPQIWLRGGYPGDLDLPDPESRRQWFANYRRLVEHYAELATRIDADLFSVGVEFAKMTRYEQPWRELIAAARARYDGPLVYAANFGEEFENVAFWADLDYIGLDNYYPLPEDLSTAALAARIEAVQRKYDKPVLFTEAGFGVYERSHLEPWKDGPAGAMSPQRQAELYQAVFEGFYHKPWLHGIFWWKVGTAGSAGRRVGSHMIWERPAMEVVGRWYRGEADVRALD